jgi:hypothetical protein
MSNGTCVRIFQGVVMGHGEESGNFLPTEEEETST